MSIQATWAEGWSPERVNNLLASNQGYVVGFKSPSMFHPQGLRLGQVKRRAKTKSPYGKEDRPHPCSQFAVHIAKHPEHEWLKDELYLVVGVAWGWHGNHPTNSKWYGKSYRIVAELTGVRVGSPWDANPHTRDGVLRKIGVRAQ